MITTLLLVLFLVSSLVFWALFFAVVLTRLGDETAKVKHDRWSFLIVRWPVAELATYKALLTSAERRKWHNWYLLNASKIVGGLLASFFAALIATRAGA